MTTRKVGVGARAHEVEVKRAVRTANGRWWFTARCSCGWVGSQRMNRSEAENDAAVHTETEEE